MRRSWADNIADDIISFGPNITSRELNQEKVQIQPSPEDEDQSFIPCRQLRGKIGEQNNSILLRNYSNYQLRTSQEINLLFHVITYRGATEGFSLDNLDEEENHQTTFSDGPFEMSLVPLWNSCAIAGP